MNKSFRNYIPIHIIPNVLNEKDLVVVVDEKVNIKDFQNSNTEIEAYEKLEELNFPREYKNGGLQMLDDINEWEMNDPRVQAMFKISRHIILSIFIFSQEYYELPKSTIRANGTIYHVFKPNSCTDVRNFLSRQSKYGYDT